MSARFLVLLSLTPALTTALALAQPATTAPAPRPDAGLSRPGRIAPDEHMLYFESMKTAVGMDAEQAEKLKGLLKSADDDFRAARTDMIPTPEVRARMSDTIKEIEAAKKAGDSQKELALIEERTQIIKTMIAKRQDMIERMKQRDDMLMREISEILRPEQHEAFRSFWPVRNPAARNLQPDPYDGLIRSPVALKAAVDRLGDVTSDQKSQIEDAFKAHQEAGRSTTQAAEQAKAAGLRKLYNDVFAVLTDGQGQRVKQELMPRKDDRHTEATSAPAETGAPAAPKP